ncbi:MAG: WYL domain-containing protein [Candidatus Polarisedimenticolaceae bacterium]|nr:WYL domain-containing protein [Candidatus Polarisedimenticolaceae bacterium]
MNHFDRIYDLHKLLASSRYPVPRRRIEEVLECSRATAKRTVESLRAYLGAPIAYDRKLKGFYYDRDDEQNYELPGLWFNASELHALLSVQQLLLNIQPGLLDKQLAPLRKRIDSLLDIQQSGVENLDHRIRILSIAARPVGNHFQPIAGAVAQQRRLHIHYQSQQQESAREISPQRLTHYRDNWYLDAWCHLRGALRTFALDAISSVKVLPDPIKQIAEAQLMRHYSSAYGIFSGEADQQAVLQFSAEAGRRVSREVWHPAQQSEWLEDGRYQLTIPYHNPAELIMDILRHGPDVEVIAPATLRQQVIERVEKTAAQYI